MLDFRRCGHIIFITETSDNVSLRFCSLLALPVIQVAPVDQRVLSPNTTTFSCEAYGVFRPNITWRKSSESLNLVSESDNVIISSESIGSNGTLSTLQLTNTQPFNATDYVCVASNDIGEDTSSATLVVNGRY